MQKYLFQNSIFCNIFEFIMAVAGEKGAKFFFALHGTYRSLSQSWQDFIASAYHGRQIVH
jgi:hypothetical protein